MNEIAQLVLGGIVIIVGVVAAIAYPRLQYSAVRQMRGVWRGLSMVPLGVMAIVAGYTTLALAEGANLWPLLLIFTAPLAAGYLLVLGFAERHLSGRK